MPKQMELILGIKITTDDSQFVLDKGPNPPMERKSSHWEVEKFAERHCPCSYLILGMQNRFNFETIKMKHLQAANLLLPLTIKTLNYVYTLCDFKSKLAFYITNHKQQNLSFSLRF